MSKKIEKKFKKFAENNKDAICDIIQAAIHSAGGENSKEMAQTVVDAIVDYGMEPQKVISEVAEKGFSEFSKVAVKFFDYMKKIENNNNEVFLEIIKNSDFGEERQNELIDKYEEFIEVKDDSFCKRCESIAKAAGIIISCAGAAVVAGIFASKFHETMEAYSEMKQVKYKQRGKTAKTIAEQQEKTARTIAKQQGKTARKAL